jgi:hypothetical protein
MQVEKHRQSPVELPSAPQIRAVLTGEGDFLPELHASRMTLGKPSLFGEEMSRKNAHTADARQKRGG